MLADDLDALDKEYNTLSDLKAKGDRDDYNPGYLDSTSF